MSSAVKYKNLRIYTGIGYKFTPITATIGSGHDSGGTSTAPPEKKIVKYDSEDCSIEWKIIINPHGTDFKSGSFTDDLKIGPTCSDFGHTMGLMPVDCTSLADVSAVDDVKSHVTIAETLLADKVNSGAIFGALKQFESAEFLSAHPAIALATAEGEFVCSIFRCAEFRQGARHIRLILKRMRRLRHISRRRQRRRSIQSRFRKGMRRASLPSPPVPRGAVNG